MDQPETGMVKPLAQDAPGGPRPGMQSAKHQRGRRVSRDRAGQDEATGDNPAANDFIASASIASNSIASAWARCRDEYKLDPAADPCREYIGGPALKRRIEELAPFQHISSAEMHRLFSQIAPSRHVLVLADAGGVVLNILSDPGHADMLGRLGLAPGFVWDERHEGTNGPGTCLHDRQPVVVHRADHFFSKNRGMTCSAVPIWGPNGSLSGILDVSCLDNRDSRESHLPMLALAGMSARIIEHLHFISSFQKNCMILRLHQRRELVGLPYDSLLAIDETGQVHAADSTVPALFGCATHEELIGRAVEDLFGLPLDHFLAHAAARPDEILAVPRLEMRNNMARGASSGKLQDTPRVYTSIRPSKAMNQASRRASGAAPRRPAPGRTSILIEGSKDAAMARNIWCLERVIDKEIHILLQGETGTGKDTFAKQIHLASARHDKPFVAVSCAAIPETLIESELFGYESGAFTGARGGGRRGKILSADGGTLFLDEIGDMPLIAQARLLRVLEEKEISPLGSDRNLSVDLRIISATHRDLPAMVARGEFRVDLYYRLNGVTLHMPALRDRDDRADLIRRVAAEENNGADIVFDAPASLMLCTHQWPGNIRELRNVLRMAVALADGQPVGLRHLPPVLQSRANCVATPEQGATRPTDHAESPERARLLQALTEQHWRIGATAASLGMSRNTLYRKLHGHGLMVKEKSGA